ncbi:thioredoxin family (seleno)protein [Planctomycetota bacterium]|nr:thioredoxin family (seleno)protein [Planctomycetota bacterium]
MMVAVIENLFVPVMIKNSNCTAHDTAILKEFGEKTWQYPVSRFVTSERKDVIPRTSDVWRKKDQCAALATLMLTALDKGGYEVSADAKAVLEGMKKGETYTDAQVKEFVESMQGGIGRKLVKALDSAVKSFEGRKFGAALKAATNVKADEGSSDEEKADAEFVIQKVTGKLDGIKSEAQKLKTEREYAQLFELVDTAGKEFAGVEGVDEWSAEFELLKKDKQVKAELKALKAFDKIKAKLETAKDDKARAKIKKDLVKFADKNEGTKAAEKAKTLATEIG